LSIKLSFFNSFQSLFLKNYNLIFRAFYKYKLNSIILKIKKKININYVFDIGAHKGDFSFFLSKTCLKNSKFFLFEANSEHEKKLASTNFRYFINVLSNKKKLVNFYKKNLTGDSYYKQFDKLYQKKDRVKIYTTTVDYLVRKFNLPNPDFIKIDTQGSEIDILKGSKSILKNTKLVYLECPIINLNIGAPDLKKYIQYLYSINFYPYDICQVHHYQKRLIQIDIIFINKKYYKMIK